MTSPGGRMTFPYSGRLHLGWQFATPLADPGPPPRRPTPPEYERLNPDWARAQRREEDRLSRPLKVSFGIAASTAVLAAVGWVTGAITPLIAGLCAFACLLVAAVSGNAVWQGERALRARLVTERAKVEKIRSHAEQRLFAWQAEHAAQTRRWQALRVAYDHQKRWYAVRTPDTVHRIDVAGGTMDGWSAVLTTAAAHRLADGGEVIVLDLTQGCVARDLIAFAAASGHEPPVWVLPRDLPRFDLGAGLDADALADVLSLVASTAEDGGSTADLPTDHAILERVMGVLGGDRSDPSSPSVASVMAALRVLGQVGDPRDDVAAGLLTAGQADTLAVLFGRAATDHVVMRRAWALESRLHVLAETGTAEPPPPGGRLRVIAVDNGVAAASAPVLGAFAASTLIHALRSDEVGGLAQRKPRWQRTLFVLGADRLSGDLLDRLSDGCETGRIGLVLMYRTITEQCRPRLGRGNAALAFMRLGNAEDAKAASEQIGSEHRFVLSQLTETIGQSVTGTASGSYTSTAGAVASAGTSQSVSQSSSRATGHVHADRNGLMPLARSASSRSVQDSESRTEGDTESFSAGISTSTSWGMTTLVAAGDSEAFSATIQRSRELLVEPHELQQLPVTAMIISYADPAGRQVAMTDANPGIGGLACTTMLTLDQFRQLPAEAVTLPDGAVRPRVEPAQDPAAAGPVSWRSGPDRPPPNLGPPPPRLDWRKRPHG